MAKSSYLPPVGLASFPDLFSSGEALLSFCMLWFGEIIWRKVFTKHWMSSCSFINIVESFSSAYPMHSQASYNVFKYFSSFQGTLLTMVLVRASKMGASLVQRWQLCPPRHCVFRDKRRRQRRCLQRVLEGVDVRNVILDDRPGTPKLHRVLVHRDQAISCDRSRNC